MYNFIHGFRVQGEINKWKIQKLVHWPMKNRMKQVENRKLGYVAYKKTEKYR